MLVADASAVLVALLERGGRSRRARRVLGQGVLAAPALMDLEVVSGLRRSVARGLVPGARANAALATLRGLPIERVGHGPLLARCWELRENVTPYDAAYVALAEARGIPVLTADARLAHASGLRCEFVLLTD